MEGCRRWVGLHKGALPWGSMPQPSDDQRYYPPFDYLRGLLATVVLFSHAGLIAWSEAGNFAVQVFFALSGWLIGGILIKAPPKELPRFYFNRAARIWIPYYISLSLILIVGVFHDHITPKWLEIAAYKITFVYNWFGPPQLAEHMAEMPLQGTGNHLWSVNAEEQFYLVAPLALVLLSPKVSRSVLTWIVVAALALYFDLYASISLGVLAAVVVARCGAVHHLALAKIVFVAITGAAAVGMALRPDQYQTLAPICSICIVLLLAHEGRRSDLGSIVGGMSYPLYLNQWVGGFVAHFVLKPFGLRDSVAATVLALVLSYTVAVSHYLYIDQALARRRGELFTRWRGFACFIAGCGLIGAGVAFWIIIYL